MSSFLMPLSVALVVLWAAWGLLRWKRDSPWGRRLVLIGVLGLTIASNKGVGILLLRRLENQYPSQPPWNAQTVPGAQLSACQIILVLGGGHADTAAWSANNRLSPSALARVVEGIRIAKNLPHAELWVSGPRVGIGQESHAHVLKTVARSLGIEEPRIKMIVDGFDTEGEAAAVQKQANGASVALVTSAWHMPRAVALFQRAGLNVVPCPSDYGVRLNDDFRISDYFAWDLSGLERTTKAVYEFFGLAWAKLRGRV